MLDESHHELVEQLWTELSRRFGAGNPAATAVPHFSYHIAENYEMEKLEKSLEKVARETAVFTIRAEGIAIFPSGENVIYIPIARNLTLTKLHERAWTAVTPYSQNSVPHYTPAGWFPHITLAHGGITPDNLGPIVTWLHSQAIAWTIPVDNLAVLGEVNGRHQTQYRFPFKQ